MNIITMTSTAAPSLRSESPIALFRTGSGAQRNAMWRHVEPPVSVRKPTDHQPVPMFTRDRAVATTLGGPPRGVHR